jgi:hypothetical protein
MIAVAPTFRALEFKADSTAKTTTDTFGVQSGSANSAGGAGASISKASIITSSKVKSFKARQFAEWGRKLKVMADKSISSSDGVILVSYFLPVILSRSPQVRLSSYIDRISLNICCCRGNGRLLGTQKIYWQCTLICD